jgi:hypothetical protein
MQEKTNGAAGLAMLETAEPLSWQDVAVRGYERSWPIKHADSRMDLSARIMALTGQRISSKDIYADGRLAVASVDGATFRLYYGGDLVMVRTCAYCSTGHFESSQIDDLSDLGYALSAWRPLHEDCEEYSSEEFPDF